MTGWYSRRSLLRWSGGAIAIASGVAALRVEAAAIAPARQAATPDAGAIEHPTGAGEAVIRVDHVGGLLPPQARLTEFPLVALYGDGRLVTQGPQIAIFPPPALPNLRQTYLTEEGIQSILAAADEAGLIGRDRRYENPLIADAPYTVVTVNAGGRTSRVAVYALGTDNPAWTDQEREEVAAIQAFLGRFVDPASWLPASGTASGDEDYPIERLQVTAQPYDSTVADPSVPRQEAIDWPLSTPISAFAPPDPPGMMPEDLRCGVVAGADVGALVQAARDTNTLTPWASEGQEYQLGFRPLLPDETGCPPRPVDLDLMPEPSATPGATPTS